LQKYTGFAKSHVVDLFHFDTSLDHNLLLRIGDIQQISQLRSITPEKNYFVWDAYAIVRYGHDV